MLFLVLGQDPISLQPELSDEEQVKSQKSKSCRFLIYNKKIFKKAMEI